MGVAAAESISDRVREAPRSVMTTHSCSVRPDILFVGPLQRCPDATSVWESVRGCSL